MIEINLLPEELKKKQERFQKEALPKLDVQTIPVLRLIGSIFAVLIIIQVILFFIGIYSRVLLTSLDHKYNGISLKEKEAIALKAQVETINKKMKAIDELMVKRFSWANKLNNLSDSMTPGIWLSELSYDERLTERPVQVNLKTQKGKNQSIPSKPLMEKTLVKYLMIAGYASSMGEEGTALIGKFIKNLKDNPNFYSDFSDIELGAIKRDKIEDQEVMNFKITCFFKDTR